MVFFIIKPDAVERNLIGAILTKIEEASFKLKYLKMMPSSKSIWSRHYEHLKNEPYYEELLTIYSKGEICLGLASGGPDEHDKMKVLAGIYKSKSKTTIRGRFALSDRQNSIHTADSPAATLKEANLWLGTIVSSNLLD